MADRLLYIVPCAAPPAQDLHLVAPYLRALGWTLCIVPTPSAVAFLDIPALQRESPHPIRSDYRRPHEDHLPPPHALLIAPMTYNTVNKWAAGIADTFALGLIAETIGSDTPVTAIPWAKDALARHPAFDHSIRLLRTCGTEVLVGRASAPVHPAQRTADFPWDTVLESLGRGTRMQPD